MNCLRKCHKNTEGRAMTNEQKKIVLENRLNKVKAQGRYIDCPGVVRKLNRQIRNLSQA